MSITLSQDARQKATASIRKFFDEKLDDEIGDLKAELLLDFVLKEIAPTVYNKAVLDAQAYFQEKAQDLDGSCYEKEFGYWE